MTCPHLHIISHKRFLFTFNQAELDVPLAVKGQNPKLTCEQEIANRGLGHKGRGIGGILRPHIYGDSTGISVSIVVIRLQQAMLPGSAMPLACVSVSFYGRRIHRVHTEIYVKVCRFLIDLNRVVAGHSLLYTIIARIFP